MWGILNWQPEFVDSSAAILENCRKVAPQIIGQRIECSWIAWHLSTDEWLQEAPVVLRIGGVNYELCWFKSSDFALTLDTIDVESKFNWADSEDSPVEWRKDALPLLQGMVGQQIHSVELQVEPLTMDIPDDESLTTPFALNLVCEGGVLSVFNETDSNGLTDAVWTVGRSLEI